MCVKQVRFAASVVLRPTLECSKTFRVSKNVENLDTELQEINEAIEASSGANGAPSI